MKHECPVCGKEVEGSESIIDRPLDILDRCKHCPKWNKGLFYFTLVSSLIVFSLILIHLWQINTFGQSIPWKSIIGLTGLFLDVWGAYFISTGFLDRVLAAIGIWGGAPKEFLPKQTWRVRRGLMLMITGFVFQALSQIV